MCTKLKEFTSKDKPYVFVANGAKQALAALFWAYKEKYGAKEVNHSTPYWLCYPTLAASVGMEYRVYDPHDWEGVRVVTTPNNPDGSEDLGEYDIADRAYGHWVWGATNFDPNAECFVYSAAKLYGCSGLRIGWGVCKDQGIADKAAQFVEIQTSGVCTMAQHHVAGIMREIRRRPALAKRWYKTARSGLETNAEVFNLQLRRYMTEVRGVPETGKGMFAFFKPENPDRFGRALSHTTIRLVSGEAFGPSYKGWYRMSMGHRPEFTAGALETLYNCLEATS